MITMDELTAARIIPVVVIDDAAAAVTLGEALVEAGITTAEVTFRTPAAPMAIKAMSQVRGLLVGAGTVLTSDQVDQAHDAGARYVVSPGCSSTVVSRCADLGLLALPGAVTASEVMAALDLGCTSVKFFPAETSGGARAIAALSAPFGGVRFVPTGGIDVGNVREYLALDCVPAVGGSWMVPKDAIVARDHDRLVALGRQALAAL